MVAGVDGQFETFDVSGTSLEWMNKSKSFPK